MSEPVQAHSITADIQGDVSGQVAVGENILQMTVHGGMVNVVAPGEVVSPKPRSGPVLLLPRPFPDLLDRTDERATVETAMQSGGPIQLLGPGGIGKTVLLRYLVHQPLNGTFPAGIVYLSGRHRSRSDLLQSLLDAFYETEIPWIASDAEARHHLKGIRALVLVDDVDLPREEIETLLDAAPDCTFLFASDQRQLWGDGQDLSLKGLPLPEALTLIERELGRPLSEEERATANTLWEQMQGHPLHLLQVAAEARDAGRPLSPLSQTQETGPNPLLAQLLSSLPEEERRLLAVLAALGGGPTHESHLNAMAGLEKDPGALQRLKERNLVQSNSPTYSLTGELESELKELWGLDRWKAGALRYFGVATTYENASAGSLREEADAILEILDWAADNDRWIDVLDLGRTVEETLILDRRWGAWFDLLELLRAAAVELGDRSAEAWVMHQAGTRALCLGQRSAAISKLKAALALRNELDEGAAVHVTQHNLNLLLPPSPPPEEPHDTPIDDEPIIPDRGGTSGLPFLVRTLIVLLVVAVVTVGGYQLLIGSDTTRLIVINEGCGVLGPTPAWLDALPGVDLFDEILPGEMGEVHFPTRLLRGSEVLVETTGDRTVVTLTTLARSFRFPVQGRVGEVILDGEPAMNRPIPIKGGGKHELIIICQ